jgi:glycine oxidase
VSRLSGLRLLVAGAGATGLAVALRLRQEGARVVLADPAPLGDNASGVAAGMLAPAFESVLDETSAGHFPLLCAAREMWPALAEALEPHGGRLDRSGAIWAGEAAGLEPMLQRLTAAGARAERIDAAEAGRLSPGLNAPEGGVFTPEDWRIEAGPTLQALRAAFLAAGGEVRATALRWAGPGEAALSDGEILALDESILATGQPPEGLLDPPVELEHVAPIKGQIARLGGPGPIGGPVVRAEGIYVAPPMASSKAGVLAGATMEAGRHDRLVEPEAIGRLAGLATRLFPDLAEARPVGAAGVRAATPDGLPLVGPSRSPGVRLALGTRRNGWLLAPLIAEIVADQLAGAEPAIHAARFDPTRFG